MQSYVPLIFIIYEKFLLPSRAELLRQKLIKRQVMENVQQKGDIVPRIRKVGTEYG
jgi:hypothetical protein